MVRMLKGPECVDQTPAVQGRLDKTENLESASFDLCVCVRALVCVCVWMHVFVCLSFECSSFQHMYTISSNVYVSVYIFM